MLTKIKNPKHSGPMPTITALADRVRRDVSPRLDGKTREELGQFLTPESIARDMATMFGQLPQDVVLLDAGAGVGSLTAAFVSEALSRDEPPRSITVTSFEVDEGLAQLLAETLERCREACEGAGVRFASKVVCDDYILYSAEPLLTMVDSFNCAILNPPYAKLNSASRWRQALRSQGIETVNLYSAFVSLAVNQLEPSGELVAITPRSFCNGPYYQPFRRHVLDSSSIERLYLFESRKTAFKDDAVLQENVIFHLRKGKPQSKLVHLETDGGDTREVPFEEIVLPDDEHHFIRLTISKEDAELAERVQALPSTLVDLGLNVSTGRIVDFRAKEALRKTHGNDTAPLIYPAHLRDGGVRWPIPDFKKYNAIEVTERIERELVPPGRYLLAKRFSSKEEKRRLVVSVYDAVAPAAFDNKLNFFHCDGKGLPDELALGLAAFLNSTAVDDYFRLFSGHTQVNATDLRNLHYPARDVLEALGRADLGGQEKIDAAVEALF
ncbi:Eco57I restriction-modification methylase domain-containing protein [Pyruvatibacter sp.]|uniref:Eco57I restriction-modification methylase domain-containing protein n=1 Tax=Pyruvatibacter sp. TaxID=1981328 RepID=UPI0032F0993F